MLKTQAQGRSSRVEGLELEISGLVSVHKTVFLYKAEQRNERFTECFEAHGLSLPGTWPGDR